MQKEEKVEEKENIKKEDIEANIKEIIEAGGHYGHARYSLNSKMSKYIIFKKSNICIIDANKIARNLYIGAKIIKEFILKGKEILFVCTKKKISENIKDFAIHNNIAYIVRKWPAGLLTNFDVIQNSINIMLNLEKELNNPKNSPSIISRIRIKLRKAHKKFDGIRNLSKKPDLLVIVNSNREKIAILEAKKINIPVIGILDSNCSLKFINFIIPYNDDSVQAITYLLEYIQKILNYNN